MAVEDLYVRTLYASTESAEIYFQAMSKPSIKPVTFFKILEENFLLDRKKFIFYKILLLNIILSRKEVRCSDFC